MTPDNRRDVQSTMPVSAEEAGSFTEYFDGTALDGLPPGQGGKQVLSSSLSAKPGEMTIVEGNREPLIVILRRLLSQGRLGTTHSSRTAGTFED